MSEISASLQPLFAAPSVELLRRGDGAMILQSRVQAKAPARSVGHWLRTWAARTPERLFLAERPAPGADWRRLTYAQAYRRVRAIGAWVLAHGLSAQRPLAILSDNGIDNALFMLGAMYVGVPAATLSPAYSLMSKDFQKLIAIIRLLEPGAIYVADADRYGAALRAIMAVHDARVVSSRPAPETIPFEDLLADVSAAAVDEAHQAVGPQTIAKFLLTSGSTGTPKAVVNTHHMLTASQEARAALWPFLEREPPVIVDWLPWSHTFGGNHNFNLILRNGGSLYIDAGRPAPGLAAVTAANLADIGPTLCFNVPRGYDMLVASLRDAPELAARVFANLAEVGPTLCFNVPRGYDMLVASLRDAPELAAKVFANLKLFFYAAAALPQPIWDALHALSRRTVGRPMPIVSGWGSTETSPLATDCHFQAERSGNIGVPVPGVALKLVPSGAKLEIRVKGVNVTPGYWKRPDLTAEAFDEEGFYRIGDAVRLADDTDPTKGLFFDGRVAEDFKLSSGTFVSVGQLRMDAIAALDPIAQDIVVTGHDRDAVGFLVFPNMAACRAIAGLGDANGGREVLDHAAVRAHAATGLARLKEGGGGASSRFAARARLLDEPPSVDEGEITDKGYINQRAVLTRRAAEVAALDGDDPSAYVTSDPPGLDADQHGDSAQSSAPAVMMSNTG